MKPGINYCFIVCLLALFSGIILTCGCMEPPVKEPTVTVQDIELTDVSLRAITLNTTVVIHNPNAVGATLNRVAFDVWYLDNGENYLGHGERTKINVKENGNTTVTIPVTIQNAPALSAFASLVQKGSLTVRVNGSAFIDIKLTEYEQPFSQQKTFTTDDFEAFIPVSALAGTGINVTAGLQQVAGMLGAAAGN